MSAQEDNKTVDTTQAKNSVSGLKYKTAGPDPKGILRKKFFRKVIIGSDSEDE